ncbi:MAG: acylphosphatase [Archaeoglobaceae archaeon]|nr:acylphosphatase [Archaeoglobaceae archaeon]MDW8128239.1 acylphosphatase [Archaeoglobaceae archaeon]
MALKITIKGKVHDVGYRLFLLEEADSLFIPCFDARNVKVNGKEALIVLVDGDKEQIEHFVEFVKNNRPEMAIVEEITVEEFKGRVRELEKFRASFNTVQLSKIVQVGVKMLEKQDLMLEKQDQMLQKQDETIVVIREEGEKTRREIGEKIEKVAEKIDEVKDRVELLRTDLRDYMERSFNEMNLRISRIEEALRKAGLM